MTHPMTMTIYPRLNVDVTFRCPGTETGLTRSVIHPGDS